LGFNIGSIKITPIDKPNFMLRLKPVLEQHSQIGFEELGSTRNKIRIVYLYVDSREKLVLALT
jgi:acetolactate synthase small subunit